MRLMSNPLHNIGILCLKALGGVQSVSGRAAKGRGGKRVDEKKEKDGR